MSGLSSKSTLGALVDNPEAKAVLAKYLPDVVDNPQLAQGRGMTLASIAQFIPGLDAAKLASIDADLAALG